MTFENVTITKVSFTDRHILLDIGRSTFYDAFGPPHNTEENISSYLNDKFTLKQITTELQNPESEFYFASIHDKIAGYIKLNTGKAQTEPIEGNALEIERIYVIKEFQGKKIGQALFKKATQIAQEKSIKVIWLGVWDKNLDAIRFYERNGFQIFDKHRFVLGTDVQTDVMMRLSL